MQNLNIELVAGQLRSACAALDELVPTLATAPSVSRPAVPLSDAALDRAKLIYEARRKRTQYFDTDSIFGEPAWDILLDVFIRQARCETTSTKGACIAGAVPATTALRWLKVLEAKGFIISVPDPDDRRRRFIRLSDETYEAMARYLNGECRIETDLSLSG